jgi:hypothetical protein
MVAHKRLLARLTDMGSTQDEHEVTINHLTINTHAPEPQIPT